VDRREFLQRSGAAALAAGALSPWRLGSTAAAAGDPRLAALARVVKGPLLVPPAAAYERARLLYDMRFDSIRPLAVLQATGAEDVRQAVLWAQRNGVPIAARSGGHSYGGYSTVAGGLVVDLRRLGGVSLANGKATIGAGARLVDVDAALAARGAAIPAGSCPTVGIAGLALGGGVGLVSRAFGTTSDNLVSLTLVTADGRIRTCSATNERDLYWACRGGGGGNFGIATGLTFRVHSVSSVAWFVASWPWEQAAEVVGAWQAFAPHAPDELFSLCTLAVRTVGPTVQCFGQYLGSPAALRKAIAPLSRVPGIRLTVGTDSYLGAQLRWAGCLGKTVAQCRLHVESPQGTLPRAAFAAKSDYVTKPLPVAARGELVRAVRDAAQAGIQGSVILDSYGGALNRVAAGATAFVHRDALCSLQYFVTWHGAGTAAERWLRGTYAAMRPFASGFAYQNYIDPELAGWRHAYYGANYARLVEINRRVDPHRLFHFAQAIGS
jgi:FAD/FMN-containing dehydrogenase